MAFDEHDLAPSHLGTGAHRGAGEDEFAGVALTEQLRECLGENGYVDLADDVAELLDRVERELAPLPGSPPAAMAREDDLVATEQAQRQDILDRIHHTRLLVAALTSLATTSMRDITGTAAWLGVDPALLSFPGQSRFEREQVHFLHAQRTWLGHHRTQLQDLAGELLARRDEFRPVPGGHHVTVDDRFDQLHRGQELDVLRVATHNELHGAESLWKHLLDLPATRLPQLLEVLTPTTLAAAALCERVQDLLAGYRAVADPTTYFSDEPR